MPDSSAHIVDTVQPFQLDDIGVMGRLVRLGPALEAVLAPHDYPAPVRDLLAQTVTLAATLASVLKFDGIFTLQAQGNGPVGLLLADVTSAGALRGYARFDRERLADADPKGAPVPTYLGSGHLAFTVDQGPETDRYQGITELEGATLSDCAHTYFRQSEQLETAILLTSQDDPLAGGALTIQRLPKHGGRSEKKSEEAAAAEAEADEDAWRRAVILMSSLKSDELLDPSLSAQEILFRLYHEDGVRVFQQKPVFQKCRCSRDKVSRTLKSFPRKEIEDLAETDDVTVTCEFCKTDYIFGIEDLDVIYAK